MPRPLPERLHDRRIAIGAPRRKSQAAPTGWATTRILVDGPAFIPSDLSGNEPLNGTAGNPHPSPHACHGYVARFALANRAIKGRAIHAKEECRLRNTQKRLRTHCS